MHSYVLPWSDGPCPYMLDCAGKKKIKFSMIDQFEKQNYSFPSWVFHQAWAMKIKLLVLLLRNPHSRNTRVYRVVFSFIEEREKRFL